MESLILNSIPFFKKFRSDVFVQWLGSQNYQKNYAVIVNYLYFEFSSEVSAVEGLLVSCGGFTIKLFYYSSFILVSRAVVTF